MKTTEHDTAVVVEPMVRISRFSIAWAILVILPQVVIAFLNRNQDHHWIGLCFNVAAILVWLVMPCHDKHFGQGRPLFWVRQVAFVIGAAITFIVGF